MHAFEALSRGLSLPPLQAQTGGREGTVSNPEQQRALEQLRLVLGPDSQVHMDGTEGTLRYLHGDLMKLVESDVDFASARAANDSAGMSTATLKALGRVMNIGRPDKEFVARAASKDELGMTHVKLDQQWDGIPVYGAQVAIHFNERNEPVQVNGVYAPRPAILPSASSSITPEEAVALAMDKVGARAPGLMEPEVRKVVYWYPHQAPPVVTYQVDLTPSVSEAWHVFVSTDGTVVQVISAVYSGAEVGSSKDLRGNVKNVNCWKDGSTYYSCDTTLPMYDAALSQPVTLKSIYGAISLQDVAQENIDQALQNGTITWAKTTDKNNWDPTAVSMINDLATIYNYYRTVHNQESIDNAGGSLISYVHAKFSDGGGGLSSDNAFYSSTIKAFVFGDGDTAFINLPAALDVTAHEFTHGVSDHLAGLVYENQSGALSEHLSDFIGCMVDRSNWTVGDGIIRDPAYVALRDLSDPQNPSVMDRLPKTMAEYKNMPTTQDHGGVHVNCGILNYASFLLTGGAQGIGREKAEKIVYRSLKQGYLTSNSQFVDYRRALVESAKDLYGDQAEASAIRQAFDAVGITEGATTPPPTPGTPTSGSELALFQKAEYDPFWGIYLGDSLNVLDAANNFTLVTQDYVSESRSAVSGDGAWALYVGADNNLYWTDGMTRKQWTDTGEVRTIAMTKDHRVIAFTTTDYDNTIALLDTKTGELSSVILSVPTDAEGVYSPLEYADVLTFNFSGDLLVFDALAGGGSGSSAYTCWGTYAVRVKDLAILPVFPASPTLQVGNPLLANTLGYVFVADFILVQGGTTNIGSVSVDLLHAEMGVLGAGLSEFAQPSFRGDDSKIIYRLRSGSIWYLNEATLAPDKLSLVGGSVRSLLPSSGSLAYPVGFRAGTYTPAAAKCDILGAGNPPNRALDFGSVPVNSSVLRTIVITNAGNADLNLLQIQLEGTDSASFAHDGINRVLPPGGALTVNIRLQAKHEGDLSAALRVKTSVPGEADLVVTLAGNGLAATLDTDHDGMPDWQEVIVGTDPSNPDSVLKMLPPKQAEPPGSGFVIEWQSVAGKYYSLSRATNLAATPGFSLVQSNIAGLAGTTRYTDTNPPAGGRAFYRIGAQVP